MFERFTDRARHVIVHAQEEARAFDHNYIGTEHLLLGLLLAKDGIAAQTLTSLGLDVDAARTALDGLVGRGPEPPKGHIPFTPRAKKSLELALRQALQLDHDYIGTEHLLLGLIEEGEGVAVQILSDSVKTPLDGIRERVIQRLVEDGAVEKGRAHYDRMRRRMAGASLSGTARRTDDDVIERLGAIEARLSEIERLLRVERGEGAG